MRVLVTGGTGVLGQRVAPLLVQNGHDATVLTHTAAKAAAVARVGAVTASASLFDRDELARAFAGHDVVLNLATHIPDLTRMARPSAWAENDRIRTAGSLAVTAAATQAGVKRIVQESITMIYVDGGDGVLDESTPFVEGAPATAAMRKAESAVTHFSGDAVILRFGSFYAAGASHTTSQLRIARRGWLPLIGRPASYQSFIHLDDAASAVVAALSVVPGTYNVTENEPTTVAEISRAMAAPWVVHTCDGFRCRSGSSVAPISSSSTRRGSATRHSWLRPRGRPRTRTLPRGAQVASAERRGQ